MIDIKDITDDDIGKWVLYQDRGSSEKGRIKSYNHKYVFVVFSCAEDWENFTDYTACACVPKFLRMVDDPIKSEKDGR